MLKSPTSGNESIAGTKPRVMSIDALRGMDMFFIVGMEEVFEALSKMFPMSPSLNDRVQHAPWAGFHFYDLIFPLFAFIMGTSMVFSLTKSVEVMGKPATSIKILKRSTILFLLGVLLYGGIGGGMEQIRLLGVLQRLALCFCGAGLAFVWLNKKQLIALSASLLIGYWALLTFVPVPGFGAGDFSEGHNLANWADKVFLPFRKWDGDHDPEGLLSTLPAIVSSMLGIFAGLLLKSPEIPPAQKVRKLLIWGIMGIAAGLLWHLQFPIIKKIWTSSFVLLTAGISSILLCIFYQIVDIWNHRKWCQPFIWIGMNSITIYIAVHIIKVRNLATGIAGGEIQESLDQAWSGLGELVIAGVGLGFSFLFCWFLFRRKIFLRV